MLYVKVAVLYLFNINTIVCSLLSSHTCKVVGYCNFRGGE